MKKHKKRRLQIASETIRQLEVKELVFDQLQAVAGATGNPCSKGVGTGCTTEPQ
jgi:hypothetical protein